MIPLPAAEAMVPFVREPMVRAYRPADLAWSEEASGGATVIVLRPSRLRAIPILAFAVFWDAFLVFWYGIAFSADDTPLMMVLFPLFHVAAGAFITYQGLVGLFNVARIRVDSSTLTFERGPIPQGRRIELPSLSIEGFDVSEQRGRKGGITYKLEARVSSGVAVSLPLPVHDPMHARYAADRLSELVAESREHATPYRS